MVSECSSMELYTWQWHEAVWDKSPPMSPQVANTIQDNSAFTDPSLPSLYNWTYTFDHNPIQTSFKVYLPD